MFSNIIFWVALFLFNAAMITIGYFFLGTLKELIQIPYWKTRFYFEKKQIQREFQTDFQFIQEAYRESLIRTNLAIHRSQDITQISELYVTKTLLQDGIFLLDSVRLIREMSRFKVFKTQWSEFEKEANHFFLNQKQKTNQKGLVS